MISNVNWAHVQNKRAIGNREQTHDDDEERLVVVQNKEV